MNMGCAIWPLVMSLDIRGPWTGRAEMYASVTGAPPEGNEVEELPRSCDKMTLAEGFGNPTPNIPLICCAARPMLVALMAAMDWSDALRPATLAGPETIKPAAKVACAESP